MLCAMCPSEPTRSILSRHGPGLRPRVQMRQACSHPHPSGTRQALPRRKAGTVVCPMCFGVRQPGTNERLLSSSVVCAGYSICKAKPSEHRAALTPLLCHRVVIKIQSRKRLGPVPAQGSSGIAIPRGKLDLQVAPPP